MSMNKKLLTLGVVIVAAAAIAMVAKPSPGRKVCEDLKSEIGAKLDAKGVKKYTLEIVDAADAGDGKVVGSCDGGTKKIVYTRK
jgi:hypothetical protein